MNEIIAIPGFAEPVASFSHLLGAGLLLLLGFLLAFRPGVRGDRRAALLIFSLSSTFLLAMSGVYHLLGEGGGRQVLMRLDHAAIFALIAGTFTAVHLVYFRGIARWGIIILVWLVCATGITLKTVFFNNIPEWLSLALYLGPAWLGLFSGIFLWRRYGSGFVRSLVLGGMAYSVGAILEFLDWGHLIPGVIGPHEIFHLSVLAGILLHGCFLLQPRAPASSPVAA